MNRNCLTISSIFILLFLFGACSDEGTVVPIKNNNTEAGLPRALKQAEIDLINSTNRFGFNIFKKVVSYDTYKNNFISPLSISMALGMTYNGANENTELQMHDVLQYGSMDNAEVNSSYQSLIDLLLNLDSDVNMELANSIWYREGFEVLQGFINVNRTYFDAEVTELDFSAPGAKDEINGWVSDKTHDKITEVIDQIHATTLMYLINALYFKAAWTYKFDASKTITADFTTLFGSKMHCRMMQRTTESLYFENELFQAVDLPYGKGNYAMTVFLPKEGIGMNTVIDAFNEENFNQWMKSFYSFDLVLYLPKFKFEYDLELKDELASLGMPDAFNGNADFTSINPDRDLFISRVIHKTFVEVNEEGTEAAAVTVVEIRELSADPVMRVDRPFIFTIREINSNTILFMGRIISPEYEE